MTAIFEPQGPLESQSGNHRNIQFRGREPYFWKQKLFGALPSLAPGSTIARIGEDVDSLLIFNPRLFPLIDPAGVDEVISLIKNSGESGTPFTVPGGPFIVLPVDTLKKNGLDLTQADLFDGLSGLEHFRSIDLENRFETVDISTGAAAIDLFILHFQVTELLKNGVVIEDYNHFYLEGSVPIGTGSQISTGVVVKGSSEIGQNVTLYPHVYIENSLVEDGCVILPGCIIRDSYLEKDVQIGPYTHLRNGAQVKEGAKMGNFVEMKKSVLGRGSKAMHLTYIGDAEVGEKVNIGAGTITCNYDGVNKNKTIIENNVFIGSGTELVAPVTVRQNSYVGAGSTITEDVPSDSLAVARQKQRNILGWVKRKRRR